LFALLLAQLHGMGAETDVDTAPDALVEAEALLDGEDADAETGEEADANASLVLALVPGKGDASMPSTQPVGKSVPPSTPITPTAVDAKAVSEPAVPQPAKGEAQAVVAGEKLPLPASAESPAASAAAAASTATKEAAVASASQSTATPPPPIPRDRPAPAAPTAKATDSPLPDGVTLSALHTADEPAPPKLPGLNSWAEHLAQRDATAEAAPRLGADQATAAADYRAVAGVTRIGSESTNVGGSNTVEQTVTLPQTSDPDSPEALAVKSVRHLISRGEHSMRVRLVPATLGEMQVEISTNNDAIMVRLATTNPAVREALEGQLADLRAALMREGVDVGSVTVVTETQASSPQSSATGRQSDQAGTHSRNADGSGQGQRNTEEGREQGKRSPKPPQSQYGALDVTV
jgi:flagellar hook-length control protein FliK